MPPLVIHNGKFNDFSPKCGKIKALLIDHNKIQNIFYNHKAIPKNIKKFDLKGKYLLPGFVDCHTHLISRGLELQRIDLAECPSLDSCFEKIIEKTANYDIVFAQNYDDSNWSDEEKERHNRKILDRITNKPFIMRRVCGHYAVVNTAALKRIPKKWKYVVTATGRLYEDAALFLNDIFKPDRTTLINAIKLGMEEAVKKGVTTIHEISDPERIKLLFELKRASRLKIRFIIYMHNKFAPITSNRGTVNFNDDNYVRFAGIKLFLDGSIGAQTAALTKPYAHSRNHGIMLFSLNKLKNIVKRAESKCIQLMIHAIGDRAIDLGLKALEACSDRKNPLRHRFEHLEVLNQKLIERLARANIIASMQPNFVRRWQYPGGLYEKYLGRCYASMNPFGRLKKAGVHLVFGSDSMPIGPIFGIKGAIEHSSAVDRLSKREAFACYTTKTAYAAFEENHKGNYKPGKLADFIVLDQDPEKIADTDRLKIAAVILGGKTIYRNPFSS